MNKNVLYIILTILLFIVLLVAWLFGSFELGYANNGNYQKEILLLFLGAILIHFFISVGLYKLIFKSVITWKYIVLQVIFYGVALIYFYNYS